MKAHRRDERDSGPQTDRTLWVSAFVMVVLGGAVFGARTELWRSQPPLAFPPIQVDRTKLKEQRAEHYGDAFEKVKGTDELKQLYTLVRRANARQFESDSKTSSDDGTSSDRELKVEITQASQTVAQITGYDGYVASGIGMYRSCRKELDKLLKAVRQGDLSFDRAASNPSPRRFEGYRRNCGRLLPALSTLEFVGRGGRWRAPVSTSKVIFGVFQRYHWAFNLENARRPLLQLTPYERELLLEWRLRHGSVDQRRRFLELFSTNSGLLPDYDVYLARARLEYELDRPKAAERALKQGLEAETSRDARYRRLLQWLRTRMSG